jgi:hypothetical protein
MQSGKGRIRMSSRSTMTFRSGGMSRESCTHGWVNVYGTREEHKLVVSQPDEAG